jgi:hypothetical protein
MNVQGQRAPWSTERSVFLNMYYRVFSLAGVKWCGTCWFERPWLNLRNYLRIFWGRPSEYKPKLLAFEPSSTVVKHNMSPPPPSLSSADLLFAPQGSVCMPCGYVCSSVSQENISSVFRILKMEAQGHDANTYIYRVFHKKLYNCIPNVTVWRVLGKRLHLKAYEQPSSGWTIP